MKEIEELLNSIGLTKQESRCYLNLYKLREAQTGLLSKKSGIATANIYPVLESLIKKGLVSYRTQNNTWIFIANSPDVINELIKNKQEELEKKKKLIKESLSKLNIFEIVEEPKSKYKYYEGISGIKAMWYELKSQLKYVDKKSVIRVCSSRKETFENLLGFYEEFHKERVKQKLKYNLILSINSKKLGEKRKKQNSKVKYLELENDVQWG